MSFTTLCKGPDDSWVYAVDATVNSKQPAQCLTMDFALFEATFTSAPGHGRFMLTPRSSERLLRTDPRLRRCVC